MKIAITGGTGEIGSRLVKVGYTPLNLELTNLLSIMRELRYKKPDVILHCAGMSSIQACQDDYEKALDVNVKGTFALCKTAEEIGAKVVLLSSEYVFNGKEGNYKEGDEADPVNSYGFTKMGAEAVVHIHNGKIIRLSRTFHGDSEDLRLYLNGVIAKKHVLVPDFIYRSYCHTDLIVQSLDYYLQHFIDMPDTLHIAGLESVSYYDFVYKVAKSLFGEARYVIPRDNDDDEFTPRPHKCGLNVNLAKSLGVPTWTLEESIERMKIERMKHE